MSYEETIKKWDEVARTPDASAAIHPSARIDNDAYELSGFLASKAVLRTFPPQTYYSVLDFGCGDGRVLRHIAGRYSDTYGFDTSVQMVRNCQRVVPVATIVHNLEVLSGEDITAVFSYAVFIHHTYADGCTMLKQLAHFFPNATFALQIPLYEVAREPKGWTDVGVWTEAMLHEAAHSAGLKVERAYVSPGEFEYDRVGHSHNELQVLTRKP